MRTYNYKLSKRTSFILLQEKLRSIGFLSLVFLWNGIIMAQIPSIRETRVKPTEQTKTDTSLVQIDTSYVDKTKLLSNAETFVGEQFNFKSFESDEEFNAALMEFKMDTTQLDFKSENEEFLDWFNNSFEFEKGNDIVQVRDGLEEIKPFHKIISDSKVVVDTTIIVRKVVSNDTLSEFYYEYYDGQIKTLNRTINDLKKSKSNIGSMAQLRTHDGQIRHKKYYLEKYKKAVHKIDSIYGNSNGWLPTFGRRKSKETAFSRIYSKRDDRAVYFGTSAALQINGNGTIVQSEMVSAFLSGMRVSFGSLISNGNEDENAGEAPMSEMGMEEGMNSEIPTDKKEAFQRLLGGGGNVYLNFEIPLYLAQGDLFSFYSNISSRLGLEVSQFSNTIDSSTGNGNIKSNFYGSISTDDREFTFFALLNYGYYFGHKDFYKRLDVSSGKAFGFGEFTSGFTIKNSLRFTLTLNTFSSEKNLRSGTVVIGTQILSGFFDKK